MEKSKLVTDYATVAQGIKNKSLHGVDIDSHEETGNQYVTGLSTSNDTYGKRPTNGMSNIFNYHCSHYASQLATYVLTSSASWVTKLFFRSKYRSNTHVFSEWSEAYQNRQSLIPAADNTYDIGAPAARMKNIYAGTSTISTSDLFEKKLIRSLMEDKTIRFIMDLDTVEYTFNDGIRTHYGLLAQQVEHAMRKNNMGTLDFAGLTISPVYEEIETGEFTEAILVGEDGEEIIEKIPVTKKEIIGETYGLRYEEFIAPLIKTVQSQQKEIEALKEADLLKQEKIESLEASLEKLEKMLSA